MIWSCEPPEASLDQDESPSHPVGNTYYRFRHSSWKRARVHTYAALHRRGPDSAATRRFAECGLSAFVQRSLDDPTRYRITTNRCRSRYCRPCQAEKARLVAANLRAQIPTPNLRLLTLTLRSTDRSLGSEITRLYASFSKLRRTKLWRRHVIGGLAVLETTLHDRTLRWHPHLHVLFEGHYLPHVDVRLAWHKITADSFVIDLRRIRGEQQIARYLAKYLTKTVEPNVWRSPDKLDEWIHATAGTKTILTFGTWRKLKLTAGPTSETDWETLFSASDLIERAKAGDPDAVSVALLLFRHQWTDYLKGPAP